MQGAPESGFPREMAEAMRARRRRMAMLPVEEKFQILLRMQKIAAEAAHSTGRPVRQPWNVD